ncbi:hypothetical protein CL634_03065 [bacterium]|nr:hypothetical protein [bacterium]|tara:strand:- start:103 stop:528 length:426 start_codon:yes stop_codon:yes gene_type:complete
MTVLEATNELYLWYAENDSFSLETDFIKVIPITEHPKRDRAAFLSALEEFEKWELVCSSKIEETKYWTLKKPYTAVTQSVSLAPNTALAVADVLNNFCDIIEDDTNKCNAANVNENDIKNLVYIVNLSYGEKKVDLQEGIE